MRPASSVLLCSLVLTAACSSGCTGTPGVPRSRPGEPPPGACESIEETLPEGTELVARFKPFPESPRDGSRRGYACVLATIDVHGEVTDVKLLSHDNLRFGDEFRAVVRRWRFDPVLIDGAAAEAKAVFTAHFERHF